MHIDYKSQTNNTTNKKSDRKLFKNYEIFQGKIRLIEDGKNPSVMERDDAIDLAKSKGMDLVQIAYNKNDFPKAICKILNYSKFMYEQQKKEKMAKKIARANEVDVKEVCFSIRIDEGDKNTKVNHIKQFINEGDKVKIVVKLLRRELHLKDLAVDTMKDVLTMVEDIAELDQPPAANGNILSCIIRKKK